MSRYPMAWTLCVALLAGSAIAATTATAETEPPPPPLPAADCATFTDPTGDATPTAPWPNDPDLDIKAVVLSTPPGKVRAYVKVDKLGDPAYGLGHAFFVSFFHGGKKVELSAREGGGDLRAVRPTLDGAPSTAPMTAVTYQAAKVPDAKLDVVWDTKNSMVVLTTDRAPIEKVAKAPLNDGIEVTKLAADSANDVITSNQLADSAVGTKGYTFGDNTCFAPPKAKLTLTAPARAVAGHTVVVAGALTDEAGKATATRTVTIGLGRVAGRAVTDPAGAFRAPVALNLNAGTYDVTATWLGDAGLGAAKTTRRMVVVVQPTRLALTAAPAGAARTLTAVLTDDLRRPLAGKVVTWSVDGKAVRTTRTDARGRTTFSSAAGHVVKAAYAGDRVRYGASAASKQV